MKNDQKIRNDRESNQYKVLRFRYLLAVILLLVLPVSLPAVNLKGLYSADVLVIDQSRSKRTAAAQDALAEVLIRVSGSSQILLDQQIRKELLRPEKYLLQYSYVQTDQILLNRANEEVLAKRLLLSFDPSLVLRTLKEAQLPIWGSNRARVLVWWGVENEGDRYLLSADENDPVQTGSGRSVKKHDGIVERGVVERLYKETIRRGVPITIPLMDLQDSTTVSTSDVWGFFTENIEVASRRYGPEAILIGRAMPSLNGEWLGSWMLLLDGQSYWYEGTAGSVDYLLAEAVDNIAEKLAEKYAVIIREDSSFGINLKVFDIHELKDYAAVSSYLDALVPVRRAHLRQVEGDVLTFNIQLDGDTEQLKQAIALNDNLIPVVGAPLFVSQPNDKLVPEGYVSAEQPTKEPHLQYRWVAD
ncbi:MAG: DUF2066 domain-containing protein [Pseudomonadales bacterium]|nr:DUF2066 domain-containing protein [Pseudomonadales bacterium]